MLAHLANFVTRHWLLVVAAWFVGVLGIRLAAPSWQEITHDGDFAYLPADQPSVAGERLMSEAFPLQRGRSQVVVAIVRDSAPMTSDDLQVAYDVGRRMKNLFGAARLAEARRLVSRERELEDAGSAIDAQGVRAQFQLATEQAVTALEDALLMDERLADYWAERIESAPSQAELCPPRLAQIYHNLALLDELLGKTDSAEEYHKTAAKLSPDLSSAGDHVLPLGAEDLPLVDTWTWRESYFGNKLVSQDNCVRIVVLQLSNEFMAVDNIGVLNLIEEQLSPAREHLSQRAQPGLDIVQSGSAAVGADLLRSAAASIKNTELFTVLLVVLILAVVYRAPLLVALPIVTIGVSLMFSTGLIALLTQLNGVPGFDWWTLKVFSTTKIFIIVILFGAGTDYCLFLIARYKEELIRGIPHDEAVSAALINVGDALAASALTTVLGLSMMFFAEFGKFCYSGPVIGLCLAIALLTCVTLTPALMRGLGPLLFWPFGIDTTDYDALDGHDTLRPTSSVRKLSSTIWQFLARAIVTRPGLILCVAVAVLLPLAGYGFQHRNDVTYDFLGGLPPRAPSRQGAEVLRRHFPVGESGPVTVLVLRENGQFESAEGRDQIRRLSDELHLPGVKAVRCAEDPLGDYAPGEKPGILSDRGRTLRVLRAHPRTKALFFAQTPELAGSLARFELILEHNPFSVAALQVVDDVERKLSELMATPDSFWQGAQYTLTGTSAAIRDLRAVTRRDNVRIQILVVLAVLVVLLVILRRPAVCLYMMLTVLFSFYVTMGITTLFFSFCYGDSYQGLDWKVPLFLFVILVAVGQDYNVYLATRVFEEQARIGPFAGLQRAVVRTGGIITSCGVIMAGTFLSMTSASWSSLLPGGGLGLGLAAGDGALRSIVELGCALALGVLLDTFIVRPILVPSFLALLCRWRLRS